MIMLVYQRVFYGQNMITNPQILGPYWSMFSFVSTEDFFGFRRSESVPNMIP